MIKAMTERVSPRVFRVVALESQVVRDTVTLNITILNVNDWDPQFKYPAYEFAVSEDDIEKGTQIGEVQVRVKSSQ